MGIICDVGIRFILGWHDLSKDDVMKKMNKLCNNLEGDASERCWNCSTHLDTCIIKDVTYGFIGRNFYNFQLTYDEWHHWGWIIEYQIDCGGLHGLYWDRVRSEHTKPGKNEMIRDEMMIRVAQKVSELLGFTEFVLLPFQSVYAWDD